MTTLEYYDQHADAFVESTVHADMAQTYEAFVSCLLPGSRVLDLGCGSGRDTLALTNQGFHVEGRDGSLALVEKARRYTGLPIKHECFEDFHDVDAFDGIWACASLLHMHREALPAMLQKLHTALAQQGVLYLSFKYGETDRQDQHGRHYTDMTESLMTHLVDELRKAGFRYNILRMWQAFDARPGVSQRWLNVLLQRES